VHSQYCKDSRLQEFGGDPSRITIFGESAGARAVDIYSFAWYSQKDPIATGFISESGAAPLTTGSVPKPEAWYELSTRLGCGGKEKGKDSITCVQEKSMKDLLNAATGAAGAGAKRADILRSFSPVVDEKTYFSDYDKRRAAGKFIQKVR
jgi:carboxylesterase type B